MPLSPSPVGPWAHTDGLESFATSAGSPRRGELTALSLFSGGGVGDYGYVRAGFEFKIHAELEPWRAEVCEANFPESNVVIGDLRRTLLRVISEWKTGVGGNPDLLVAAPPCQGMSMANHHNGSSHMVEEASVDPRNALALLVAAAAVALQPRVIVVENVPGFMKKRIRDPESGYIGPAASALTIRLHECYEAFPAVIPFANHGVPQRRVRAVITFIKRDESALRELGEDGKWPYPRETHGYEPRGSGLRGWPTALATLSEEFYEPLDSKSRKESRSANDDLHFVPIQDRRRYRWVEMIPPYSARSAFLNDECMTCSATGVPRGRATCHKCGELMLARPHVSDGNGGGRLIIGHHTSYRRIPSDLPLTTITTTSGQFSTDTKIHPWQNRVLSVREAADHQTVPRCFNLNPWSRQHPQRMRTIIGESMPPWFTYQHGMLLSKLLNN